MSNKFFTVSGISWINSGTPKLDGHISTEVVPSKSIQLCSFRFIKEIND